MAPPNTIDKNISLAPGKDFNALLTIAMDKVKALASEAWTDYNEHDPGVTTLEQLAYGLTEIGYKADLPIQDLLCKPDGSIDAGNHFFYTARQILTVSPVTISDYRKLLLDYFQEMNNVWIEPAILNDNDVASVYHVKVSLKKQLKGAAIQQKQTEIKSFLNNYRNLSEYFEKVTILDPHVIGIAGKIHLQHNANADEVLEQILFNLKGLIEPEVKHYSVDTLLGEGRPIEDIFSGPVLRKGYIKTEELTDKIKEISITQVLKEIMAVTKVAYIEELNFTSVVVKSHKYTSSKSVEITEQRVAAFDADATINQLHFYSKQVELFTSAVNAATSYYGKKHADKSPYQLNTQGLNLDILPPTGNYTNISKYYSIQNHFPQTYGLGQNASSPTNGQRAKVNQFRAYLAFFEQHMANALSQLANAKYFFNFEIIDKTNYSQSILDYYEMNKVLEPDYLHKMDLFFNVPENKEQRIHSFLKHVLSRFSEQATPYTVKNSPQATTGAGEPELDVKLKLLKWFVEYSAKRARAPQYLINEHGYAFQKELTGLELKLQCLLNIDEHITSSIFIIEHFLLKNSKQIIRPGFYSNTVSVIFILDKEAYHDKNYRQYIIETTGHLFPAHLLPNILFLNDSMPELIFGFRKLFCEWVAYSHLPATAKKDGSINDKLAVFIDKNTLAATV